ncbi:MAG TPA: hypothetical protein VHA09_03665 [Nitrososphaera sp.]|nr:hypothetical protein [Nitrososphaera sp.]
MAAGIIVDVVFVMLFSTREANPPLYRVQSVAGQSVSILDGASKHGGQFEQQTVNVRAGGFVKWTNNKVAGTNLVTDPACKKSPFLQDSGANVTTQSGKVPGPADLFTCGFDSAD